MIKSWSRKSPCFYISVMTLSIAVVLSLFFLKLEGIRLTYTTAGAPIEWIDAWCMGFHRAGWMAFGFGMFFWTVAMFKKESMRSFIAMILAAVFVMLQSVCV